MYLVSIKQKEHFCASWVLIFSNRGITWSFNFGTRAVLFCDSQASTSSVKHKAHIGLSIKELHFEQMFLIF